MKYLFNLLLIVISTTIYTQTITGIFPTLSDQWIRLSGYNGFNEYYIDSIMVKTNGQFALSFDEKDHGIGYLSVGDNIPYIVILAENENLHLEGESFSIPQTISISSGKQNLLFGQYAVEQPKREQALMVWDFLEKMYKMDSLFCAQDMPLDAIETEKKRLKEEDSLFLNTLDSNSYLAWYLPVRKLVSSVATIAQYRRDDISATIISFRELDYADPRLYKSGLLREAIEGHFWLIQNSNLPGDSVILEMNKSIDTMVDKLVLDEEKLNVITDYLFLLFERHSLFESSEHLALKVLNEAGCTIDHKLAAQLESYRAMKKGQVAPQIEFTSDMLHNETAMSTPKRLSEIQSKYKVILFGASWCPRCKEELSKVPLLYSKWKSAGVEVVFISLDTEAKDFKEFATPFPFFSSCDYLKWEGRAVKDYHVFATPTIFLLNRSHEILLKPGSVKQLDDWVKRNLLD